MKHPHHEAICDWLQLDPGHYDAMVIEPLGDNFRITFLDDTVSDWNIHIEDGVVTSGYCFNDVI